MNLDPANTFSSIVAALEIEKNINEIQAALASCSFSSVQQRENENGFKEKSHSVKNFFRKGIVGDWENTLTKKQIDTLVQHHKDTMYRLGYLDDHGAPLVLPQVRKI